MPKGRCRTTNRVRVLFFYGMAFFVHLFNEAGVRSLASSVRRHMLDLVVDFLEDPKR